MFCDAFNTVDNEIIGRQQRSHPYKIFILQVCKAFLQNGDYPQRILRKKNSKLTSIIQMPKICKV